MAEHGEAGGGPTVTTCTRCGSRFDEPSVETPTGQRLCPPCGRLYTAYVAGAGAFPPAPARPGGRWLTRLRKAIGRA